MSPSADDAAARDARARRARRSDYPDLVRASEGYKDGRVDARGRVIERVELRQSHAAAPARWMNQPEVREVQAAIQDILGTTFQTQAVARSLLTATNGNIEKLRRLLKDYRHDHRFCRWAQRVGLRAFAFKGMLLTKYHATEKVTEERDWYSKIAEHINR